MLQSAGGGSSCFHLFKRLKIGFVLLEVARQAQGERERERERFEQERDWERESLPFIPTVYHFPR